MDWFWLFRRSTARFPTVEPAVRSQIVDSAEENGIAVDEDSMTGRHSTWTFTHRYEWEIRCGEDAYVVVEEEYISVWWYVVFFAAIVIGFGSALLVPPPVNMLGVVGMIAGISVCIHSFFRDSPLDATITTNEAYRSHPAGRIVALLLVPVVLVTAFMALLTLTTTPEFWAVTFVFAVLLAPFLMFFRYQRSLDRFEPRHVSRFYSFIGGYLMYMVIAVCPASIVIALRSKLVPSPSLQLVELVLVLGLQLLILGIVYQFVTVNRLFDYHTFLGDKESVTVQTPAYRVPVLFLVAGMTYAVLYILWYTVRNYAAFITVDDPLVSLMMVLAVVPLLYIPVGVVHQTVSFAAETRRLFAHSEEITVEDDLPVSDEVQIRELEVDDPVAGSFSTGINDYIFVSEPLLRRLDRDEIASVVAHEDGHIHHRDALLSFLIPIAAVPLLAGKNVLYAVFDFHSREYRADQYAVERVGEEPLRQALQKIASATDDTDTSSDQPRFTASPTLISASRLNTDNIGIHDRYFGAYFGNFALTEAHPSLDERIRLL